MVVVDNMDNEISPTSVIRDEISWKKRMFLRSSKSNHTINVPFSQKRSLFLASDELRFYVFFFYPRKIMLIPNVFTEDFFLHIYASG